MNTISAIIGAFVGLGIYGFGTIMLEDKIDANLRKIASKQLEKDSKYKGLLEKIELFKERLRQEIIDRELKEEKYRRIDKRYSDVKGNLQTKKLDYDYLSKKKNPTENTIHMTRDLRPDNK